MSKRTFRYEAVGIEQTSSDLREEALHMKNPQTFLVTIFSDESYERAFVERADVLYDPESKRMGIAWGTDATWADVDGLESGIEMYLNDGEEWDQRN
jgi:hypothetical protein